jgi:hypothetical protein
MVADIISTRHPELDSGSNESKKQTKSLFGRTGIFVLKQSNCLSLLLT